jgi:hypothetical protein
MPPEDKKSTQLPAGALRRLPLCYQTIRLEAMIPVHVEQMYALRNKKYNGRVPVRGSLKPISKIVR